MKPLLTILCKYRQKGFRKNFKFTNCLKVRFRIFSLSQKLMLQSFQLQLVIIIWWVFLLWVKMGLCWETWVVIKGMQWKGFFRQSYPKYFGNFLSHFYAILIYHKQIDTWYLQLWTWCFATFWCFSKSYFYHKWNQENLK